MKILIISDGQNWIVDRISQTLKERITDHEIDVATKYSGGYDLIHYNNVGVALKYADFVKTTDRKQIVSVRSFRYNLKFMELTKYMDRVHVINRVLLHPFGKALYIPDGVFVEYEQLKPFKVGMAFQDIPENWRYKGEYLVSKVCTELGLMIEVANNIDPEKMIDWYRSLDLFICASEEEGFSAPAMECLALNVPVLTTRTGEPANLNCHFFERNEQSLKEEILKFYTQNQVIPDYSWNKIAKQMQELYESI